MTPQQQLAWANMPPQNRTAWCRAVFGGYSSFATETVNRDRRNCRIGRIAPTPAALEYFDNMQIDPAFHYRAIPLKVWVK